MIALRDEDYERLRSRAALYGLLAVCGWLTAFASLSAVYIADMQAKARAVASIHSTNSLAGE